MIILDKFPTADEFYKTYWGKKPFMVRGYIDASAFDDFIDGDEMAGLSLEDDVKSRMVTTAPEGGKWTCDHGPFEGDKYETLDETHWSLLVQNVDQFHPATSDLLKYFDFSPRWLMDDIMVSYSTIGGSVGPHTDSYHVFLVQGIGKRAWTIGDTIIENEDCIPGLDLKVLKDGVDGDTVEVNTGDVIYVPPHFGHAGTTLENAMTFSVGFLGPQLSELFIEYGYYLEQFESLNIRYSGQDLTSDSARFAMSSDAQKSIADKLINVIQANDFATWLADYFSSPSHAESVEPRESQYSTEQVLERLEDEDLYRPEHVKFTIINVLSVYGTTIDAPQQLIDYLKQNDVISLSDVQSLGDNAMGAITQLYNQNALFFEGDDLFDDD